VGTFFLQGEPQEKAYRESLSEALGVLRRVGEKGLGSGEIREKAEGSLWAYKKQQRCIFNEHMLVEVQTYKNRLTNKFVSLFLYVWTFPLPAEKCIAQPRLLSAPL